jgi:hypothetical protein
MSKNMKTMVFVAMICLLSALMILVMAITYVPE